jgi:hypothetical protein
MLSFQTYRTVFGIKPARVETGEPIEVRDFVVQNPGVTGQDLAGVLRIHKDLGFLRMRLIKRRLRARVSAVHGGQDCAGAIAGDVAGVKTWFRRSPSVSRQFADN